MEAEKSKRRRFLRNTVLLTLTSLVMRTIGVKYRVWLNEGIGAAGMGLYELVMSVYSLTVTFASSGLGLASSRLTAEAAERGSGREIRSAVRKCAAVGIVTGLFSALFLFLFAGPVGRGWLGDARTVSSLRLLGVSMPFVALSTVLGGYFSAVGRVARSAGAGFAEQVFKIGLVGFLLKRLLPYGTEYACLAVVAGTAAGEIFGALLSLVLYFSDLRRLPKEGRVRAGLWGRLLSVTVPVALTAWVRSALTTVEHILIPAGLKKAGAGHEEALASYGIFSGMTLPVVFFPASLVYSMTGLMIPDLAARKEAGDTVGIRSVCERFFRFTLAYGILSAAVLVSFARPLCAAIYGNPAAGEYLALTAPLIPVMYLDTATDSMLKGLGEQLYCMKVNLCDAAASVVLVWLLVPRFGVNGYILVIYLTEIFNAAFSIARLLSLTDIRPPISGTLLYPLAASAFSVAAARAAGAYLFRSFPPAASMVASIALTVGVYALIQAGGTRRRKEPGGSGKARSRAGEPVRRKKGLSELSGKSTGKVDF